MYAAKTEVIKRKNLTNEDWQKNVCIMYNASCINIIMLILNLKIKQLISRMRKRGMRIWIKIEVLFYKAEKCLYDRYLMMKVNSNHKEI